MLTMAFPPMVTQISVFLMLREQRFWSPAYGKARLPPSRILCRLDISRTDVRGHRLHIDEVQTASLRADAHREAGG